LSRHAIGQSSVRASKPISIAFLSISLRLALFREFNHSRLLSFGHRRPAGDLGARAAAADADVVAIEFANLYARAVDHRLNFVMRRPSKTCPSFAFNLFLFIQTG
jgi:hypothetical protein